ncbi:hypothetical protein E2C01_025608 [Portunus trituberculatus]|uniref:Uncharacterized protein n=1 Tax=Portunus trituberculatus TaxID=210409 RepID=A0A5B7EFR0_PORTR|nr:hypothetical protein [Portunus trituberculatus]
MKWAPRQASWNLSHQVGGRGVGTLDCGSRLPVEKIKHIGSVRAELWRSYLPTRRDFAQRATHQPSPG